MKFNYKLFNNYTTHPAYRMNYFQRLSFIINRYIINWIINIFFPAAVSTDRQRRLREEIGTTFAPILYIIFIYVYLYIYYNYVIKSARTH